MLLAWERRRRQRNAQARGRGHTVVEGHSGGKEARADDIVLDHVIYGLASVLLPHWKKQGRGRAPVRAMLQESRHTSVRSESHCCRCRCFASPCTKSVEAEFVEGLLAEILKRALKISRSRSQVYPLAGGEAASQCLGIAS